MTSASALLLCLHPNNSLWASQDIQFICTRELTFRIEITETSYSFGSMSCQPAAEKCGGTKLVEGSGHHSMIIILDH